MTATLLTSRQPTVLRHGINPKHQNVHHWAFRRKDFTFGVWLDFRNCTCLQSRVDPRMHAAFHSIQPIPMRPSVELMSSLVDRHKKRSCGCWNGDQVTIVNLLAPTGFGLTLELPCQWTWVDRVVWKEYIQPHYAACGELPKGWHTTLQARHKAGHCDCSVPTSAGAVMARTSPDPLSDLARTG